MNKYNDSKIYVIKSNQSDRIYIGSTCLDIYERLRKHRQNYRYYNLTGKKYIASYEILKFDDHYIELLEKCNFFNNNELIKKEGEYMKKYKNIIVNLNIPK